MNPFIELMQAGALIMLLFGAVLISVVIRNTGGSKMFRLGPAVIGAALVLFAVPIYASVIGTDVNRFTTAARVAAAVLLPVGLYLLGRTHRGPGQSSDDAS